MVRWREIRNFSKQSCFHELLGISQELSTVCCAFLLVSFEVRSSRCSWGCKIHEVPTWNSWNSPTSRPQTCCIKTVNSTKHQNCCEIPAPIYDPPRSCDMLMSFQLAGLKNFPSYLSGNSARCALNFSGLHFQSVQPPRPWRHRGHP